MAELFQAYQYCRVFHVGIDEYERRPYRESQWMLQIDHMYNEAIGEANEP